MNLLKYIFSLICLITMSNVASALKINYKIAFQPKAHYAQVTINVKDNHSAVAEFKMPVWTPGSYLIREYAKNIDVVTAKDNNGNALVVRKTSKDTWKIDKSKISSFSVSYRVYCFELAVRNAYIAEDMAYLNGAAVFMYLKGAEKERLELTFIPDKSWNVLSTALPKTGEGYWERYATDIDELFDSPIQIGNHETFHFTASGVPHEVAMVNAGKYDSTKLKGDYIKIIEEEVKIFGHHPCKNYVFIVHHLTQGSGGLEHKNSTTLQAKPTTYENEASYNDFFRLVAHEYFHLWNVKRLRPEPLGPFNYQEENYTSLLWVAEGFTAYYDDLILFRSGLGKKDSYLGTLAGSINYATNSIGSKVQSVAESSMDAWIKYYRPSENSGNTNTDYYTKGSVIALALDLMILKQKSGEKSLDDVMRTMYEKYYRQLNRGYTEAEFKHVLESMLGFSLDDFFAKYIHGKEVLTFDVLLANAGLVLENKVQTDKPFLGMSVTQLGTDRLLVRSVQENYPAMEAGIYPNDVITAVNGAKPVLELFTTGTGLAISSPLNLEVNRDVKKLNVNVLPINYPFAQYSINPIEKLNSEHKNIQKKWFGKL